MKIPTQCADYEQVVALSGRERLHHKPPRKPSFFFRGLVRLAANGDLKATGFSYTISKEAKSALVHPCLILMNHSSFIDLEIVSKIMFPRPYNIVCTSDGFVGKEWLMRQLGCIPTQKFVPDATLLSDMKCALAKGSSVLMYPEASYTFDGCPTPLPEHLPGLFRSLGCPVVMIRTEGAFSRDPLYNCLQKRQVKVTADVTLLLSANEATSLSYDKIRERLAQAFDFDGFAWQKKNGVEITEDFRADGLERILYKCAACGEEGGMTGKGVTLTCSRCGKRYTMDTLGRLHAKEGETEFLHIPDWYRWERTCVQHEIEEGRYRLDEEVEIGMMVDYKAIYMIGNGRLVQDATGFTLTSANGRLLCRQNPQASYGLYADYYWYEIGDMICIGGGERLFYCFPKGNCPVAKARMAAEELYKIERAKIRGGRAE